MQSRELPKQIRVQNLVIIYGAVGNGIKKFYYFGRLRYSCKVCLKCYKQLPRMHLHIKKEHFKMITDLTCNICRKVFANRGSLNNHKKQHHFASNWKCTKCSKPFHSLEQLNVHGLDCLDEEKAVNEGEVRRRTTSAGGATRTSTPSTTS